MFYADPFRNIMAWGSGGSAGSVKSESGFYCAAMGVEAASWRIMRTLLGHANVMPTEIYTHEAQIRTGRR